MLQKIKDMMRNNPNFKLTIFGGRENFDRFIREQEKVIRDLTRR